MRLMSVRNDHHPSLDQLSAFDSGSLPPAAWSEVERHVAGCGECCRRLEALPDDTLVALLRDSVLTGGDTGEWGGQANTPEPASPAPPALPAELADHPRYRILGPLGAGGMGSV